MVSQSIRQTEDHLRAFARHHSAHLTLLLSGIGSPVPSATSPDGVYFDFHPLTIPHDSVDSYPYFYAIIYANPEPYSACADTHFHGYPNSYTYWHSYGDGYGHSHQHTYGDGHNNPHRDPNCVAIPHSHGDTDEHRHPYGNSHGSSHGNSHGAAHSHSDINAHSYRYADAMADSYRN